MQQYFINSKLTDTVIFNDEQSHHIAHVMRMKEGEIVKVVDCEEQAAYVAIHYDGKMEKVGYHYKDLDTTKDKIMAIPFMFLRIIFVKIFGGFFKLIGGAIYHIYKKCCPIINWN